MGQFEAFAATAELRRLDTHRTATELAAASTRLHEREIVPAIADGLSAIVYTQLSDVEDGLNGLLSYDRRVARLPDSVVQSVTVQLNYEATIQKGNP